MSRILKVGDIAEHCGVSARTVRRWIREGLLEAYQIPNLRKDARVTSNSLLIFLREYNMPIPTSLWRVLVVSDQTRVVDHIMDVADQMDIATRVAQDGFQVGSELVDFAPSLVIFDAQTRGFKDLDIRQLLGPDSRWRGIRILTLLPSGEENHLPLNECYQRDGSLNWPVSGDVLRHKLVEMLSE